MTLQEFLHGIRILWNIEGDEYIACINKEDREHFGDDDLMKRFLRDPQRTFVSLPDQDQKRVFAIIEKRNKEAGLS